MITSFNDRGPFKVGEMCVIVSAVVQTRFNGCEAVILEVLAPGMYGVDVRHPDGGPWIALERSLRRKRPPLRGEQIIRAMFAEAPQSQPEPEAA